MKVLKRRPVIIVLAVITIILVAGVGYAAYFASTVNPAHQAAGKAVACEKTVPTNNLRTFHILPAQTTASYQVHENLVLHGIPDNLVVGKTQAVQGDFQVSTDPSPLVTEMKISVDLRNLQTDDPHRDHYVQKNYLQTETYPTTDFVSTCATHLPASYHDGQTVGFQITGNMTLHGKTNKEVFDVRGNMAGQIITGTATTTVYMTDFGINPPNLANIAISQNKVLVAIVFTAKEGK